MKKLIPAFIALLIVLCACTAEPPQGVVDVTQTPQSTPQSTPQETEQITPPLTQSPSPAPTAQPTPGPEMVKSRVNTLNFRSVPSSQDAASILGQLAYEEQAEFLGVEGDFTRVRRADGSEGYCYSDYLVPAGETLYAYLPATTGQKLDNATGAPVFEADGVTPVMVKNELIDLRLYLPDAVYELLFATPKNITGAPLYPRAIPLLQKDAAVKLQRAYDRFKADGYTLKIYDAYRPKSVQQILYDIVQNRHWIANPKTTASNHNRGCAVDISLISDQTGEELEFPTAMHTFREESARTSKAWSQSARANVDYMTKVMNECGFVEIESEWWHFAIRDSKLYMTTDIDLASLTMLPDQGN